MLCPRCEQGDVISASVRKTSIILFICQECEATWFSKNDIGQSTFVDFGTYMEEQGSLPLWDELDISAR